MTETMVPRLLKPALSPRLPAHDVPEPQTGLDPSTRQEALQTAAAPPERLVSLDAYRGLVMVLMVSAGLGIGRVVKSFDATPELRHLHTPVWDKLAFQTDHVAWAGCSLWDLIQPSFMFMVGAAVPFSIASRRAKGQSFAWMLFHAVLRSLVLIFLGIFLMSNWSRGTTWTFVNVLTQIGMGYTFLFLVAWLRPRWQLVTVIGVLVAYWALFALYPAPQPGFELTRYGLPETWERTEGFAAHWEKNTNVAAKADQWFLNLFPRPDGKPFEFNDGGYQTLNFIPSLATMIFGLLAGELVRGSLRRRWKVIALLSAGVAGLAVGWALGWLGICPVVKRIWTPSWAIYSAGWSFGVLALFYLVIDVARLRAWSLPLVVVGMNSVAIYCMSMLLKPWVRDSLKRHTTPSVYDLFGSAWSPMVEATVFLLFCWAMAWWMYRSKAFLRISDSSPLSRRVSAGA